MGSAALVPQVSGHVVNVLRVFGRTVVFDMIHADGPTFNLTANTTERRVSLANESNETHTHTSLLLWVHNLTNTRSESRGF